MKNKLDKEKKVTEMNKQEKFLKILELAEELDNLIGSLYTNIELDVSADLSGSLLNELRSIPKDDIYWSDF